MSREPIAIVGIGCRLPGGGNDPGSFWRLLCDGVDAIREVPADRWSVDAYWDPVPGRTGKSVARWGGFVDDVDRFDPAFFGISPREAALMDPQQRMLLETAWEALEDAGCPPGELRGSPAGVFVGISTHDYELLQSSPDERVDVDVYSTTGGVPSIAANRVSYCFDLRGPSVAIDTACSSSLIAAHLACRALWSGDCRLALVGGVNALLAPMPFVAFSRMSMLSPTGRCRAFDAAADGFVRAEGAGMVVLKPLGAALADGDRVYAAIRATAANQDGRTNGITVPSRAAQAALVHEACRGAGVAPADVRYVEAHGTGTAVGDPIEAGALGEALGAGRPSHRPCVVGSVKTNVGHLEAGAGIAGLIKLALVLHHGRIPPNLHFRTPNPDIDFERLKLRVPTALEELPPGDREPTIAGINSFGFGGSNAHAVLQAIPGGGSKTERVERDQARLLVVSARGRDALVATAGRYRDWVGAGGAEESLDEICRTAGSRRTHHEARLAVVGRDRAELAERLGSFASGDSPSGVIAGTPRTDGRPDVAFVFSGQGPQWWGMGRELFREEPVFREVLEACDRELARFAGWRLLDELSRDERESRLAETAIAQPAIFALQAALAALWRSWGIRPAAVVGHSVGEVAAAHVAGILTLADAVHVIFERGRCMDLAPERGRMLAARVSPEEATELVAPYDGRVVVGAINAPASVTLSGDADALAEIAARIERREIFCRFLQVNYAFHSAQMDPIRAELLRSLGTYGRAAAEIPMISTVTGGEVLGEALAAEYWWRNVRQTVRFAPAIDRLVERGWRMFLEIGPHPAVGASVVECLREREKSGVVLPSLRRHEPERATMLASLGALHVNGMAVDWRGVYPRAQRLARLPAYVWQRERFWHESPGSRRRRLDPARHPFLARDLKSAGPAWEGWVDPGAMPYLRDHAVQGHVVFPAAGYVEIAAEAADRRFGPGGWRLEDVDFVRALVVPDAEEVPRVQLGFDPEDSRFTIASALDREAGGWTVHCTGRLRPLAAEERRERVSLARVRARCATRVSPRECYRRFREAGLSFGPAFRGIAGVWRRDGEALARVRAPASIADDVGKYRVHPALLDACFQALSAALPEEQTGGARLYLPVHVERITCFSPPGRSSWSHARLIRHGGSALVGDVRILDERGVVTMTIEGFRCQAVRGAPAEDPESWLYESRWEAKPLPGHGLGVPPAAFVAPPARAAARAEEVLARRQAGRSARARFLGVEPDLDRLCRGYVAAALRELGWRPRVGRTFAAGSLAADLGVAGRHRRAFGRFLERLVEDGTLRAVRGGWRVRRAPQAIDCEGAWRALLARFPALYPELALVRRAGTKLARILRGRSDPLAVIAPGGSLLALEQLYQDAPSFADYNRAVAAAVAEAVESAPAGRTIRVLEIGAGTGGTTAHVLARLPGAVEYVFSDVSATFFPRAEQKFFDHPRLRCQLLDVERSPAEQGFEPHSFDVVLACDALHATASVADSLAHARELLAAGGLLALLEIDRVTAWVDLVFGLTPGWWRFRDRDLRAHHPLLGRAAWRGALEAAGFRDVATVSDVRGADRSGQTLLLARAPSSAAAAEGAPREGVEIRTGVARRWLLLADRSGTAEALGAALAAGGARTTLAFAGARTAGLGAGRFEVDLGSDEALRRRLEELAEDADEVVHLWSLDGAAAAGAGAEGLLDAERRGPLAALHLVQALAPREAARPPRLWFVTRGSQPVGEGDASPLAAPLWGLGRVIQNEHKRLRCRLIDLDPQAAPSRIEGLLAELRAEDPEEEIALRAGIRHVNRLSHAALEARSSGRSSGASYRLEISSPGSLDALSFTAAPRRRPGPGEVEIEVAAAALNFRDVMKALGIYPVETDEDLNVGDECAGRIVAVGRGVEGLREGDAVFGMAAGSFASHRTLDARRLSRIPRGLSFAEAATIPVVFLTAWYALHHLGRLRRGEKLLVHAATGGVGLAALQIAELAGAEVFATAGSPEKRDFLRALGVRHVMDSRSLAFADRVAEATGGRGVDLVLNSLAGEAIAKGLETLAPHGRFLEIGKRDVVQDTRIGLRPFRKSLSMFVIDLPQVIRDQGSLARALFGELLARFADRRLRPLPHRTFSASDVAGAFRFMAKAQHVGKIVVAMDDPPARLGPVRVTTATRFRAEASYLVTGGLGGFGLAVAEWMAERGARHLVLAGRSGASTPAARRAVRALRRRGVRVLVTRTDVGEARQVAALLRRIGRELPPLRGVFHAAMVLDDGVLAQLDAERFRRVLAPKAHGAWNLHVHSLGLPLDFFVLFSSVSSIVGAPAQGNYAAANAFLDALAHHRRAQGLAALAVNWGQLAEVGYVARNEKVEEHLTRQGILGIRPAQALGLLDRLLRDRRAQVGVVRVDWQRWAGFLPAVASAPRFAGLVAGGRGSGAADAGGGVRDAVLEAPAERRLDLVTTHLREQVARVLRSPAAKLPPGRPLAELGVDSLMAFELVNRVEAQFQLALPTSRLAGGVTIERLASVLLETLTAAPAVSDDAAAERPPAPVAPEERILVLRRGGARPPLFCIHPAGGLANIYRHLAERLPADLPVFAVQSRAIADGLAEAESVAALAADYATEIVERQPQGPYRLLGFSLGGIFALAVARTLEDRGAEVGLLGIVDCDLSLAGAARRDDGYVRRHVVDMYGTFARELALLRPLGARALEEEAADLAARVAGAASSRRSTTIVGWLTERRHLVAGVSPVLLERYFSLFEAHVALVEGFSAPAVGAPILLWHRGPHAEGEREIVSPWRRCSETRFEEHRIEGGHYDLMFPPLVDRLAADLDEALRRGESPERIPRVTSALVSRAPCPRAETPRSERS